MHRMTSFWFSRILVLQLLLLYAANTARIDNSWARIQVDSTLIRRAFNLTSEEHEALLAAVPKSALEKLLSSVGRNKGLEQETLPRNGIPEGAECEESTWCDKAGICSIVCKRGSLKFDPWQKWAMDFQLSLSRKQPFCYSQTLASHNSAITLAEGYGNRDTIYSAYLKWLGTLGARHELQTNNQWLSLTDQLNLGVRVLELDVHFVADELRIAHCGGLQSHALDLIVRLINSVAKLFGREELVWDVETLGCSPSLSSIPVQEQRLFSDALAEVAAWLQSREHQGDFLVLHLDNQPDLATWHKLQDLIDQILAHFPKASILAPAEALALLAQGSGQAPSVEQLVQQGKRLLLLSGTDYGTETEALIFSRQRLSQLCPYSEAWKKNFRFHPTWGSQENADDALAQRRSNEDAAEQLTEGKEGEEWQEDTESALWSDQRDLGPDGAAGSASEEDAMLLLSDSSSAEEDEGVSDMGMHAEGNGMCYLSRPAKQRGDPAKHYPLFTGNLVRLLGCELRYGPADCHFHLRGMPNEGMDMDEEALAEATACGVNFPAPDRLTPARAAAHIWAWAANHPPTAALGMDQQDQAQAGTPRVLEDAACTFAHAADGRWRTGACAFDGSSKTVAACRLAAGLLQQVQLGEDAEKPGIDGTPKLWVLLPVPASAVSSSSGMDGSAAECPTGYVHDIPHTAVENLLLRQAMKAEGAEEALLPLAPPSYLPNWLVAG